MDSINVTVTKKKLFKLALQWGKQIIFVNGTEIYKFQTKDCEIVATLLCLGNISKDWSVDNMKKTEFNGCFYDFKVDYDYVVVDDILDIHKYLMKNNKMI